MAEIEFDVETSTVLAMLDALGPAAEVHVHAVSKITAERIQIEARARARRATGALQEAITVEEVGPPMHGYRVYVDEMVVGGEKRAREFPLWHEFGTKRVKAQPFLYSSAELEEGPHLRRLADALGEAIVEVNE